MWHSGTPDRPKPFYNNPLNTVNKKGFNLANDRAIYAIGAQFPQQVSAWFSIEGLGEIQNGHINRYMESVQTWTN